jgi:hypothetical protein
MKKAEEGGVYVDLSVRAHSSPDYVPKTQTNQKEPKEATKKRASNAALLSPSLA